MQEVKLILKRRSSTATCFALLCSMVLLTSTAESQTSRSETLLSASGPIAKTDPRAIASSKLNFNRGYFENAVKAAVDREQYGSILVQLPDKSEIALYPKRAILRSKGKYPVSRLSGAVQSSSGNNIGEFSLTSLKGEVLQLAGSIRLTGGEVYRISSRQGKPVITLYNSQELPGCATHEHSPQDASHDLSTQQAGTSAASSPASNEGWVGGYPILDMVVVWTPYAAAAHGGSMDAFAVDAVESVNDAFVASFLVPEQTDQYPRVRLVGTAVLTENAVPIGGEADCDDTFQDFWQTDAAHPRWNEVPEIRNQYGADLVHGIFGDLTCCGKARLLFALPDGETYEEAHGYSITQQSCTTSTLSLAHELGHSFGGNHENLPQGGYYIFSRGYTVQPSFADEYYGTLTARRITTTPTGDNVLVNRIGVYSSPNISYIPAGYSEQFTIGLFPDEVQNGNAMRDSLFLTDPESGLTLSVAEVVANHRERCIPLCTGDLDGNGTVGFPDLTQLLNSWGPAPSGVCTKGDINKDLSVGFPDLTELLSAWGPCEAL